MELQDYDSIELNEFTMNERTDLFTVVQLANLPYEWPDNVHLMLTIEVDLSLLVYERTIYTMFEMLSDVGGLSGIFMSIFSVFIAVWNFNTLDNFMVSRLYKVQKTPSKSTKPYDADFFPTRSYLPNVRDLMFAISAGGCCCRWCRPSRREKAMLDARSKLDRHLNIIEMVK